MIKHSSPPGVPPTLWGDRIWAVDPPLDVPRTPVGRCPTGPNMLCPVDSLWKRDDDEKCSD